jgi:hypothetical protein
VRQLKISRNVPRVAGSDLCAVRLRIYNEKFEGSYLHPVVSTVLLFAADKGAGNASCGNNIRLSSRSESMVVEVDAASFRMSGRSARLINRDIAFCAVADS